MKFVIEPTRDGKGFQVTRNGWGLGVTFETYDGAVRVVNAIADEAVNESGVTTIDYSACLDRSNRETVRPSIFP